MQYIFFWNGPIDLSLIVCYIFRKKLQKNSHLLLHKTIVIVLVVIFIYYHVKTCICVNARAGYTRDATWRVCTREQRQLRFASK